MNKGAMFMEDIMFIMMIFIVIMLFSIVILISRLMNMFTRIIKKVEEIAKLLGVPVPSDDKILQTFISNNEKMKAIRRYREITGSELKEATDYVEKLLSSQEEDTLRKT